MNCIIIDDEPLAIKVIEKHLSMLNGYVIHSTFNSALPVYKFLQENRIDLIFLDIEMPNLSGLNFLKTLANPPQIILTTAHREYALESYDYKVADYLLKPISFERFLKSISKLDNRVIQNKSSISITPPSKETEESGYTFFKIDRSNIRIEFDSILYIESVKNHVKLVLKETYHMTHMNLHEIESKLDKEQFIRVHKSFIINVKNITSFTHSNIELKKHLIPIGRTYKIKVLEKLNKQVL